MLLARQISHRLHAQPNIELNVDRLPPTALCKSAGMNEINGLAIQKETPFLTALLVHATCLEDPKHGLIEFHSSRFDTPDILTDDEVVYHRTPSFLAIVISVMSTVTEQDRDFSYIVRSIPIGRHVPDMHWRCALQLDGPEEVLTSE